MTFIFTASVVVVLASVAWMLARRFVIGKELVVWPLLLAAVAGAVAVNEYRWYTFESKLARAVTPIVGDADVKLECERFFNGFFASQGRRGHVWFDEEGTPASSAFLSMSTCADVKDFIRQPDDMNLGRIQALHVVAHEAAHLSGIRSESKAECLALEHDPMVMIALGATADFGQRARQLYMKVVYPELPTQYNTPRCEIRYYPPAG